MLLEVVTGAVEHAGITRAEVDFTCAGSCDYVAGQAFSFVQNTDAIGAWPPKRDSHVEMDGAWAHVRGVGAPAAGRHRRRGGHGLGPLVDRRPGADLPDGDGPVLPGAARRRPREPGRAAGPGAHRQRRGDRAADGRDRGPHPPRRQGQPARPGERRLRRRRAPGRRLRHRAAAPPRPAADHRRRLRRRDRPGRQGPRAERQPDLDHRPRALLRAPLPGHARPAHVERRTLGGQGRRARRGARCRWPSSRPRSPTRSRCWSRRSASVPTWRSTRRAARWPPTRSWPPAWSASIEAARRDPARAGAHRSVGHSSSGPCLQQNLVCILEGND